MGDLTWNGEQFLKDLDDAVIGGIADALFQPFVLYLTQLLDAQESPPFSAPGEVPHRLSGRLGDSLMIWAVPSQEKVCVGFTSPYALALELGGTRMAPRPFMAPAIITMLDALAEEIHVRAAQRLFAGTPPVAENVNLNPLTVETSDIPSTVPSGKSNVLPSRRG